MGLYPKHLHVHDYISSSTQAPGPKSDGKWPPICCFSLRRLKRITVSQVGLSYVYDVSLFVYTNSWDLVIFTSGKLMFRSPIWLDIPGQIHLIDLGNIPQPCMSRTSSVGDSSFPIVLDYGFPRPWPWLLPCRRGSARVDFSYWQVTSLIGNLTNGDGHGTCHP